MNYNSFLLTIQKYHLIARFILFQLRLIPPYNEGSRPLRNSPPNTFLSRNTIWGVNDDGHSSGQHNSLGKSLQAWLLI